jgi:molybdenum cofactor guanylyltransferase
MAIDTKTISGVILAGGKAKRMNYQDKGLLNYKDKPIISYAISAMSGVVGELKINVNHNLAAYKQFNLPLITDLNNNYDGPLAGILSAMHQTTCDILVVMPCDSPLVSSCHLQQLINALADHHADIAVAFDGIQMHSVFLAIKTKLKNNLENYLGTNQKKVAIWLDEQNLVKVNFKDSAEVFFNINTADDLKKLELQSLIDIVTDF